MAGKKSRWGCLGEAGLRLGRDDVYYYIEERLKLEMETENIDKYVRLSEEAGKHESGDNRGHPLP